VVNQQDSDRLFAITKYYTIISPRIKLKNYLPAEYTIEFDTWLDAAYDSNPGIFINFLDGTEKIANVRTSANEITCDFPGGKLNSELPKEIAAEAYYNKWHHIAIAVKDKQLKVYVDQFRVLVVPDNNFKALSIAVSGDASDGMAMLFKNFRLAAGGGMNTLEKKFTGTKIITHGINFDYNKASLKPESMGTFNSIVQIMKNDPSVRFEIGGHTDASGDDAYNLKLSQQRADAVKAKLVSLGIDASRFTTKGYGETKPIADNITPEGKANNRRVEFTKLK
jgi:outer membrane protein OmpA-like peptidoglycan-associated protein